MGLPYFECSSLIARCSIPIALFRTAGWPTPIALVRTARCPTPNGLTPYSPTPYKCALLRIDTIRSLAPYKSPTPVGTSASAYGRF